MSNICDWYNMYILNKLKRGKPLKSKVPEYMRTPKFMRTQVRKPKCRYLSSPGKYNNFHAEKVISFKQAIWNTL